MTLNIIYFAEDAFVLDVHVPIRMRAEGPSSFKATLSAHSSTFFAIFSILSFYLIEKKHILLLNLVVFGFVREDICI